MVEYCRGRKRKARGDNLDEDYETVSSGNESNERRVSDHTEEVTAEDDEQNQFRKSPRRSK